MRWRQMTISRRSFLTSLTALGVAAPFAAKAQDPLVAALEKYKQELERAERAAGYIGPRAYIPQADKVTDGIYTVIGSMIWHNPSNYGLNNNLTFMEFEDGIFIYNAGANPALAQAFHEQIKAHTKKPVKWLAVENNQGHAHLGSSYWYDMGVRNFYSEERALNDIRDEWPEVKARWGKAVGYAYTDPAYDISDKFTTFETEMEVDVGGGEKVVLFYNGPGHTPGATIAYVPSRNIVFTGDLAFNGRMLALFNYTSTQEWIKTFEKFEKFVLETDPNMIIMPGHGVATDLATVKADTYDYLVWLTDEVKKIIANGGSEVDAENIDQSAYKDRSVYEQTHRGNARHIYRELMGLQLNNAEG